LAAVVQAAEGTNPLGSPDAPSCAVQLQPVADGRLVDRSAMTDKVVADGLSEYRPPADMQPAVVDEPVILIHRRSQDSDYTSRTSPSRR
jgi:hypothetical protein